MSRFYNLELGGQIERLPPRVDQEKDEHYFLAQARVAFMEGRFEKALRQYSKVLEHAPKCAAAWAGQVRMLIELAEFDEAKLWADKALETFPEESELLAAKAVALARIGDPNAALVYSDNAVAATGNAPYVWLARGDVLLSRREPKAAYCFDQALALASGDWVIQWLAARIHFFYRQFARAIRFAQQALDLDATQAAVWLDLGRCQQALGLIGPARHSFTQARELDPACEGAGVGLIEVAQTGLIERWMGRLRELFNQGR